MKATTLSCVMISCSWLTICAQETITSLKVGEITYQNVSVTSSDNVGITIAHETGMARIPFAELPVDLQKKYNYNPEKASIQQQAEAEFSAIQAATTTAVALGQQKLKAENDALLKAQKDRENHLRRVKANPTFARVKVFDRTDGGALCDYALGEVKKFMGKDDRGLAPMVRTKIVWGLKQTDLIYVEGLMEPEGRTRELTLYRAGDFEYINVLGKKLTVRRYVLFPESVQ